MEEGKRRGGPKKVRQVQAEEYVTFIDAREENEIDLELIGKYQNDRGIKDRKAIEWKKLSWSM